MHYRTAMAQGYLRAEIYGRNTADETQEFIRAVRDETRDKGINRVLVWVRNSRPIFQVEKYGLSDHFKQLAEDPSYRVALLADSAEVRSSHEYVEMLARQQGASLRSFRDEASAISWLTGAAQPAKSGG